MKVKVTRKSMKEGYEVIIGAGYCKLQYLLRFQEPFAYSTRTEGWACDYYDVDGTLISTGYAPIDSKRAKCTYDLYKKYDSAAEKILYNYDISQEEKEQEVNKLLKEFILECRRK